MHDIGSEINYEADYLLLYKVLYEILMGTSDSLFSLANYDDLGNHLIEKENPLLQMTYVQEQHANLEKYSCWLVSKYPKYLAKSARSPQNYQLNRFPESTPAPDRYRAYVYLESKFKVFHEISEQPLSQNSVDTANLQGYIYILTNDKIYVNNKRDLKYFI